MGDANGEGGIHAQGGRSFKRLKESSLRVRSRSIFSLAALVASWGRCSLVERHHKRLCSRRTSIRPWKVAHEGMILRRHSKLKRRWAYSLLR